MNITEVNDLIKSLGQPCVELEENVLLCNELLKLEEGGDKNAFLTLSPEPGVEMWIWVRTKALETVLFCLMETINGDAAYSGALPSPFSLKMTKRDVRALLGEPYESSPPSDALREQGYAGTDYYRYGASTFPDAQVGLQYREDGLVCTIGFSRKGAGLH